MLLRYSPCLLGLLLLTLGSTAGFAQEADRIYKPFKVNLSIGYARPVGSGSVGGFLFSAEPKYGITDNIDLGLRAELAGMARAVSVSGRPDNAEIRVASSFVLTGTYLLPTEGRFRPYAGLGAGVYSVGNAIADPNNPDDLDESDIAIAHKLGAMLRAGFKFGHLNVGAEYNLVPRTRTTLQSVVQGQPVEFRNSYLGIKLGFDIGGGRY